MATKQDIIKVMAVMAKAYANYAPKEGTAELYYMILADIPNDALEAGAKMYLATPAAFFPSPGQWRDLAVSVMMGYVPSEYEAWENVTAEMKRCGPYFMGWHTEDTKYPEYKHPLIARAVGVIGYASLYNSDNLSYDRGQFFKIYAELKREHENEVKLLASVRNVMGKYQLQSGDVKQIGS